MELFTAGLYDYSGLLNIAIVSSEDRDELITMSDQGKYYSSVTDQVLTKGEYFLIVVADRPTKQPFEFGLDIVREIYSDIDPDAPDPTPHSLTEAQ